jgi:hypothetical protein
MLLFLFLLAMTVGPRLRLLRPIAQPFNVSPFAASAPSEAPTIARVRARRPLPVIRRSAALETYVASVVGEAPERAPEDMPEPNVELEPLLPSTPRVDFSALPSPDRLSRAQPPTFASARPRSLAPLYGTFAALQAADAITTIKALQNPQRREANPLIRPFARSVPAMLVLKGASTAVTVVAVEKLWRKNRVAAVATMVSINVGYAILVSRNAALQ